MSQWRVESPEQLLVYLLECAASSSWVSFALIDFLVVIFCVNVVVFYVNVLCWLCLGACAWLELYLIMHNFIFVTRSFTRYPLLPVTLVTHKNTFNSGC